jgi:hypothetical protein
MDGLFELIAFAFHWRMWVVTLAALAVAIFLASTCTWFTGAYGIALVLMGFGAGLMWEGTPRPPQERTQGDDS